MKIFRIFIIFFILSFSANKTLADSGKVEIGFIRDVFRMIKYSAFLGNEITKLKKWNQEINFNFFGEIAEDKKLIVFFPFKSTLTNTELNLKANNSPLMVWVIDPAPIQYIKKNYEHEFKKALGSTGWKKITNEEKSYTCNGYNAYNADFSIKYSIALLDSNLDDEKLLKCSSIFLMKSLGFYGEMPKGYDSVLSDGGNHLTPSDILMIRLLYSEGVSPGINYSEFLSAMRKTIGNEAMDIILAGM